MRNLCYISASIGATISLDGPTSFVGTAVGIRGHAWSYEASGRSIRGIKLPPREASVGCNATHDEADALRRAADSDIASGTPGTLVYAGQWRQRCYIVSSETDWTFGGRCSLALTILFVDGYWWREVARELFAAANVDGLDYPHDHPNNLGHSSGREVVDVGGCMAASPRITFRGPCINPYILIAGNRYEVDVSVPSGSKLVLDATEARPTVTLCDRYGNERNVFAQAVRDGGQGGGSYAFEAIPLGEYEVTWSGGFGFELAWRERDTEPPWNP